MDRKLAEELFEEFHTPLHVRRHCEQVAKVSVDLATKIKENGHEVDIDLIEFTALIHDLVRVVDFREWHPENFPQEVTDEDLKIWNEQREKYAGTHHADALTEALKDRNIDEAINIASKHKYVCIVDESCKPTSLEEKIIYYADKRVKHDEIVALDERFTDGRKRYSINEDPKKAAFAEQAEDAIRALEKELLSLAGE